MDYTTTRLVTLEELMNLDADRRVEVVNGEVVDRAAVGALHHFVGGNIYRPLDAHVNAHDLGVVFFDGVLYLLHREGKGIKGARVPDVSFIRKAHVPQNWNVEEPIPGHPDLAVEVMSPHDKTEETLDRVRDYLRAGTEQVWVVFPKEQEVHVYQHNLQTVQRVSGNQIIDTEGLFPGLQLVVASFFVLPEWVR